MPATRINLTAEQSRRVREILDRPELLGSSIQTGRHGYIELDIQARRRDGVAGGAIVEIAPDGRYSVAAATLEV